MTTNTPSSFFRMPPRSASAPRMGEVIATVAIEAVVRSAYRPVAAAGSMPAAA